MLTLKKKFAKCLHFILRKLRVARKGKNRFTSSPNILRSVLKTDKEEGLRREEGRNRPVCSLVRPSSFVRGDMVASSVDPARGELKSRFDEMVAE